jgi:formate dehydrogenase subunit gamma
MTELSMPKRAKRLGLGFLLFAIVVLAPSAAARQSLAQQAQDAPNPTAQAVTEQQLLERLNRIEGRVTIPDPHARVLEQPQGREYREFHERLLPWLGAIAIVGMLLALTAFYVIRGPITLDRPGTGIKIQRFDALERFTHWLTATSFIVLAITGLNYVFGKRLLMPLMSPDTFAIWSQWAKYLHNAFALPFMLGLLIMMVLWIRDNIPDRYDLQWLREFGGFLSHRHPPALRFNAGQKLIFWSGVLGGLALVGSGLVLMFPDVVVDIAGIQVAQYVHAVAGIIMIAIMLAHIYIGTIGMRGALAAMVSGEVDLAWGKQHHRAWVAQLRERNRRGAQVDKGSVPAE